MNIIYTIKANPYGTIGQYATLIEAQEALRYLPYRVRQYATIERS